MLLDKECDVATDQIAVEARLMRHDRHTFLKGTAVMNTAAGRRRKVSVQCSHLI
jgi:hypothetical protein